MGLRIGVTGSAGLVGTAVRHYFTSKGHTFIPFIRKGSTRSHSGEFVSWDIDNHEIDFQALEGLDVIIHLAGANIAGKRWTKSYKDEIKGSRIEGTKLISQALAKLKKPPEVLLSGSAIGYYGPHDPEDKVSEKDPAGDDFLSQVCVKWEEATQVAEAAGIRVVHMRIGTVLDSTGGALAKMLPIFQMGLGGVLGSGKQMFSWILLDELVQVMNFLIIMKGIRGPVNCVAPHPVSNREFTKTLGDVINRPTVFPVPSFGLRLLYGDMADTLLLKGAQIFPNALLDHGYQFEYPELEEALHTCFE